MALRDRERLVELVVIAAPGVVMELVFRQGSFKHAFWGFNLLWPAAFAAALLAERARAGALLVAAQAAFGVTVATQRLVEEHGQSELGHVAQTLPRGATVAVVARGTFHPYVSWYADGRPVTVKKLDALPPGEGVALVDTEYARTLSCAWPAGDRWRVLALSQVREACPALSTAQ